MQLYRFSPILIANPKSTGLCEGCMAHSARLLRAESDSEGVLDADGDLHADHGTRTGLGSSSVVVSLAAGFQ